MKAGLLILPFLAILIGAVGTAVGSALPDMHWIAQASWAVAAGVLLLWVGLDVENFKAAFLRKGAKYGASSGAVIVLGVLIIVGIGNLASRPRFNKSIDMTRDKLNTLSDQSKKLVEQLAEQAKTGGKPVTITAFVAEDAGQQQLRDLIEMYQAAGANFVVEYVDPNKNPTRAMGDKVTEGNTVIFRRGEQEKRISTFNEEKLTNALVNVLKDKSKKIYFTTGHGEGSLRGTEPNGFATIVTELEGNKDKVEELSLLATARVPDDADALVIAGPKYDFKEEETRVIEDFLKRGGSVLVMENALAPADILNKTLEKFGVKFNDDIVILEPNSQAAQMIGQNNAIVSEFDDFNPVTKDFARQSQVSLVMPFTRTISEVKDNVNNLKVTLAGKTPKDMVRVKDVRKPEDLSNIGTGRVETGEAQPVIAVAFGKTQAQALASNTKDDKGTSKTDAAASGSGAPQSKETRLIVTGSSHFASNDGVQRPEHKDMFLNMTSYLLQDDDFISIRPKDPTKSTVDITSPRSQIVLLVLAFIYPFFFLGSGTYAWLRRRRA